MRLFKQSRSHSFTESQDTSSFNLMFVPSTIRRYRTVHFYLNSKVRGLYHLCSWTEGETPALGLNPKILGKQEMCLTQVSNPFLAAFRQAASSSGKLRIHVPKRPNPISAMYNASRCMGNSCIAPCTARSSVKWFGSRSCFWFCGFLTIFASSFSTFLRCLSVFTNEAPGLVDCTAKCLCYRTIHHSLNIWWWWHLFSSPQGDQCHLRCLRCCNEVGTWSSSAREGRPRVSLELTDMAASWILQVVMSSTWRQVEESRVPMQLQNVLFEECSSNFTGRARAKAEGKPKRSTEAHDLCPVLGSHLGICSFRLELRDEDEIKAIEAEAWEYQ